MCWGLPTGYNRKIPNMLRGLEQKEKNAQLHGFGAPSVALHTALFCTSDFFYEFVPQCWTTNVVQIAKTQIEILEFKPKIRKSKQSS